MYKIIRKEVLAPETYLFEVEAPEIAQKCESGHFVIIRLHEKGERIPLSIADYNRSKGTITLIVLSVGKTTRQMATLKEGGDIMDVAGPLGNPSIIDFFGKVVCCGGGLGIAPLYPLAKELKEKENTVLTIIGAKTEEKLFYENELRSVSNQLYVTTDDGSKGKKGFVTDQLKELFNSNIEIDRVFAIGPAIMMKAVADLTRPLGVKTIVSLNSICIDGTGLCGACRVEVNGETKFTCTDGPEFDAHKVDFNLLMRRLNTYTPEEQRSEKNYLEKHRLN